MKPTLNYEAEPLEIQEESHCGGDCPCEKCRAQAHLSREADFEYEEEAASEMPEGFEDFEGGPEGEADFEAGFEDFEVAFEDLEEASFTEEPLDCASVTVDCDMSAADEKKV